MKKDRERREDALLYGLAIAVALPSLWVGFHVDDWWQVTMARTRPPSDAIFQMFQFAIREDQYYPCWWKAPDLQLSFFRPISAGLVLVDNALFGNHTALWHAHQVGWWLLLVGLVRNIFKAALPRRAGFLATLAFIFDEGHSLPIAWLANRNAVVASVFALSALIAHVRWRKGGGPRWLAASLAANVLAFGAGEAALGGLGFLLAWEALVAQEEWRARLRALAPQGVVVATWAALYRGFGYGTHGSGSYFDPGTETLSWAWNAPGRALALLGQATIRAQVDLWYLQDIYRPALIAAGALGVAWWVWFIRQYRAEEPARWYGIRWLVAGALLAMVPVLSTFPASRLMLLPSVGAAAVIGAVVDHVYRRRLETPRLGWPYRWSVTILAALAFVVAPLVLVLQIVMTAGIANHLRDAVARTDMGRPDSLAMMIVAPDPLHALYLPAIRFADGAPLQPWGVLSMAPYDHVARRTSAGRLEVEVIGGHLMSTEFERLLRGPQYPMRAGDVIPWGLATIEILAVDDVGPTKFALVSDGDLDDPRLTWLQWRDGALHPMQIPAVGAEVFLPREIPDAGLQRR